MSNDIILAEARDVTKRFPGVLALDKVCLRVVAGKVNALMGENGAGKSTLMNILSGVYTDYEGEIFVNNELQHFGNVVDAQQKGIAIIHQELNLIQNMNIAENMFLGKEPVNRIGLIDYKRMHREAKAILDKLHLDVDTHTMMHDLRVGQQQLVEIGKALMVNAKVLIMDEPTSSLSEHETEILFNIIGQLTAQGAGIVYISHKMNEVWQLADFVTIFRDGKFIAEKKMSETCPDEIVNLMVGRERSNLYEKHCHEKGEKALEVEHLCMKNPDNKKKTLLSDISLHVRKGEVLGIYGLMGAGRTELLEAIFGLHPSETSATIRVNGQQVSIRSPHDAAELGIALCPEDRKLEGLVLDMSIEKNTTLASLKQCLTAAGTINAKHERQAADNYREKMAIKSYSAEQTARQLSGGNQQKIVLSKWLMTKPEILFLDEPTRGIDIHAKQEIYQLIDKLSAEGMAIICVSSELPEIMAISDRIITLQQGSLSASFSREEFTEESILKSALPQ